MKSVTASVCFTITVLFSTVSWAVKKIDEITYAPLRDDSALVYFIRPAAVGGKALKLYLYVDKTPVAVLPHATYAYAYVKPGKALLWGSVVAFVSEFEFIAGAEQYVDLYDMRVINRAEGRNMIEDGLRQAISEDKDKKKYKKYLSRYDKANKLWQQVASQIHLVEQLPKLVPPSDLVGKVMLPAYTEIKVAMLETITSAFTEKGSPIQIEVSEDLHVASDVVISKGTPIEASVVWSRQGGSGGMPGAITIEAPSVTANDGTKVPLTGRIYRTGDDQFGSAQGAAFVGGIIGAALVKGREAFLFVGQELTMFTRDAAWLTPGDSPVSASAKPNPLDLISNRIPSVSVKEVKLSLGKRKKPKQVLISILVDKQPTNVRIVAIQDRVLDQPLIPLEGNRGDDGWTYSFDSWEIIRRTSMFSDLELLNVEVAITGEAGDGLPFKSFTAVTFKEPTSKKPKNAQ